ncbi:CHAT domain-containing protein [Kamptonema formosum]|uniref:CHAT domain-containing protein n=1 Tax=Kamptonema formosum TaxID=331992 RepID=UPI00034B1322|nr:CHAT domain-containing protein [Oscillatoria sp. PCC 10802]
MPTIPFLLKTVPNHLYLPAIGFFLATAVLPAFAQHPPSPHGLQTIPHLANNVKSAATLLEQGRSLYEAGRFAEAAAVWQQAAKEWENKGNRLNQALSLSLMSSAYQELGQWSPAQNATAQSLELLASLEKNQEKTQILAQVLNTQGSLLLAVGQPETALDTWQLAAKTYAEAGDEMGSLGSEINQAQALQSLGLYRRAKTVLERVSEKLQEQPDSTLKATGLRSLGIALQVVGDLGRSQEILEQSLAVAQQLNSPANISAALFSLGNSRRALEKRDEALVLYQKAAVNASSPLGKLEAQLNELSLLVEMKKWADAHARVPQIQSELAKLSPSRETVYAQVNLAESLMAMASGEPARRGEGEASLREVAAALAKAAQQAKMLRDPRAESYALGTLGKLYKQAQQWEDARNVTERALQIAGGMNAGYIAARWQAQLGEILKELGDISGATAAYSEAVNTLQSLRSDLVAVNPEVQFSFRESVEPVYRELVSLLLDTRSSEARLLKGEQGGIAQVSQKNLKQAREVIEDLQLAELDNFFREACLDAKPQQIDEIDSKAAVIYPIILRDRLEAILSLPGQPLRHYTTQLPQKDVEKTLDDLLQSLNPFFSDQERLRLSQEVYDWLVRPAQEQLASQGIKTLVFVPDGAFRNLPMAALHDGQQYLVEKYSVALTPGLQLLAPRSLVRNELRTLTAGLTEARQGFSALPGVNVEVTQIASEVPSKVFLNQQFTETNLQKQIGAASFRIVHLATHGQFSSDPEKTFILTWDGKIKVREFEDFLRSTGQNAPSPVELLVLSACQTAAGDRRAALGLAGVAVRSGARSTLATLWSVKDESTAGLMAEFYREIAQPGVSKAEALRQAQLAVLKQPQFQHPFYWAPFILVGNWL